MAAKISNIYQFKIILKDTKPIIWRRIQVPAKYSFGDLHLAIQEAMGWQNYHTNQFEIINPKTGQKDLIGTLDDDGIFCRVKVIAENKAKIAQYFRTPEDRAIYEYDFGDGWEHLIILEKILPAVADATYPQCLAGEMACPPEECGGVSGYKELLQIIANPNHKEYKERIEWLGGDFYPEKFDPKFVKFSNASKISNIYQFQIILKNSKPKVWRRIQVPANYSFEDLHLVIQDAMGWQNYHLNQFEIMNPKTGQKDQISTIDDYGFCTQEIIPEDKAKIADYFLSPKDMAIYEYDFGDGWEHAIILEKKLTADIGASYPRCIAGKMACPPEDCGGVAGYEELLKIIANPRHKEYKERIEWLYKIVGADFNPVKFDPKLVKFRHILRIPYIYQFQIILKDTKPKIWRRILVPGNYSFEDLHLAIQDAMGWKNYHLNQFEIINPMTGRKDLISDDEGFHDFIIPEDIAKIAEYFLYPGDKAIYEYDFGDGWEHVIILEKVFPGVIGASYPQCLAGRMACPPEDCGGVTGYKELLKIIANPNHKEYRERIQWLRGGFNPEMFKPKLVKFCMRAKI